MPDLFFLYKFEKKYYVDVCVKEHWFPMLPFFYSNQTMSILANY